MNVLEVKDLSVQYPGTNGALQVVRNISFTVEKGSITGIAGESGSGKSTAMLAVMGLLDVRASVQYDRIVIGGMPPVPGRNVAMIFQDSLSCLNPSVKIGRQIAETVRNRKGCSRKVAAVRAEELLKLVGIRNPALRMRQYPFELSGGMRQRIVLAIALACEPELIIADEPTTALDAVVQAQILQLLRRIVKETGTSLLMVSHDMGVMAAMCRDIYVMHDGRIIEQGTAEDIFYAPAEEYTKQLLKDAKGGKFRAEERSLQLQQDGQADYKAGTDEPLIRMDHVTRTFDEGEGVRDLCLEIRKGEILALVGESGSGKTTAARILTGMLKEDQGTMYYKGNVLQRRHRIDSYRGRVQMVFQDPYASLNPHLTVRQALNEALDAAERLRDSGWKQENTVSGITREKRIQEILTMTGLSYKDADRYPRFFSGGQRQRIGIARALITEPELLVCDEAISSLDATTREQILELIFRIQRKIGFACLFISHDMHVVRRISDRIAVMYSGHIVETGKTKNVCNDPWHPYTKLLLESVPEPDPIRAAKMKPGPARECIWQKKTNAGEKCCPFAERCGYALDCCGREIPDQYRFGIRGVSCFLYSDEHSGRRSSEYKMTSQI